MKIIKFYIAILIQVVLLSNFYTIAQTPTFNEREYLTPFWTCDTMFNESVLMVAKDSDSSAEASLLFSPLSIISVKDAKLSITYTENIDWVYSNGKLTLLPGSKATFMTNSLMYPTTSSFAKVGGGYVLWSEGHYFHDRQLAVTYTHSNNIWEGPIPKYAEVNLPNTIKKLTNGDPLKVVFYGNSITAGYNSSKYTGVAPYMPNYAELVVSQLKSTYKSTITYKNAAVAGTDAAWGLANVKTSVTSANPDLVIISFGMNDGTAGVSPVVFKSNIVGIMNNVKASNPNAEFILIATTLANPETYFAGQQVKYEPYLQTLIGVGTELVNMTGVHQELLKYKAFRDMTGNNINHPNDFLHRWYAQQICAFLIPASSVTSLNSTNSAEDISLAVYPNPSKSIFNFRISGAQDRKTLTLNIFDKNSKLVADLSSKLKGNFHPSQFDIDWDASNQPAGVYFASLKCGKKELNSKAVLIL